MFELSNLSDLSVEFKNESIYIRAGTAHHGVYSSTYQFKWQNGTFPLVGLETQSITPGHYAGYERNVELWGGKSVNFATAEAIYWAQAFEMDNPLEEKKWRIALKRFDKGLQPAEGKRKTVRIKLGKRVDLKHFDPYDFKTDFLCQYFDHNLRFRNSCK